MDYFNNVLTTFLGLKRVSCIAIYAVSESSRIWSKKSWFVFRRWTTGLEGQEVINDRIVIFVWTIPLKKVDNLCGTNI